MKLLRAVPALSQDVARRVHDRPQPRDLRPDGRSAARRVAHPGRSTRWFPGPRIFPSGHAITPTGGRLDPTMFAGIAPGMMPLTVEEGIANGVSEVR